MTGGAGPSERQTCGTALSASEREGAGRGWPATGPPGGPRERERKDWLVSARGDFSFFFLFLFYFEFF